jgi:glycosyltransferase involved in cell wall biosynthesis
MEAELRQCLECLAKQTYGDQQALVVDNEPAEDGGVSADTGAVISAFDAAGLRVRGIGCRRPGSYHARNAGVLNSQSELIAFFDSDCQPLPEWLEAAIEAWDTHPAPARSRVQWLSIQQISAQSLFTRCVSAISAWSTARVTRS